MNIVEQAEKMQKTWTTAEVVNMIQRATYRNASDTADVEDMYQQLGLTYTSPWIKHCPVGSEINTGIDNCVTFVRTLEHKEGIWYSADHNARVARVVEDLKLLKNGTPI